MQLGKKTKREEEKSNHEPGDHPKSDCKPHHRDPERKCSGAADEVNAQCEQRKTEQHLNERSAQHDNDAKTDEQPKPLCLVRRGNWPNPT